MDGNTAYAKCKPKQSPQNCNMVDKKFDSKVPNNPKSVIILNCYDKPMFYKKSDVIVSIILGILEYK